MLQKQSININFAQGLDTKTDPWQVVAGKFLALENSIFLKGGLLQKRNGYKALAALPSVASYLTTFSNALTAIGSTIQALSSGTNTWVNRGNIQPLNVATQSLIKNNLNQNYADVSISDTGLVCTVYAEVNGATTAYKYVVADSISGQNIVQPTAIPSAAATYGTPRVFALGNYFIILYARLISASYHLSFYAISTVNPSSTSGPTDISTSYAPGANIAFDAAVLNTALYVAWNGASASGIKLAYVNSNLAISGSVSRDATHTATKVTVSADPINQHIWVSYWSSATNNGFNLMVDPQLNAQLAATQIITSTVIANLGNSARAGVNRTFYEVVNTYSYNSLPTNYVSLVTCTEAAVITTTSSLVRSVGLASKPFYIGSSLYFLAAYQSQYQPTYFLMTAAGQVIAQLAYQNGGGYVSPTLPNVVVNGQVAQTVYLYKDVITAVNKNTNVPTGSQVAGIYSQTGINLAAFDFSANPISTEIGANLNITGGITWAYDGYSVTEQNFFLYPDAVGATLLTTGGSMHTNATYFYQVVYEWTDNQGNIFRSAPSVPVSVGPNGNTNNGSVQLNIPTLRLTYKTANPVKITVYRWSSEQSSYYQTIANYLTAPTLNNTAIDFIPVTDTLDNATILGNNLLYTTGGVVENVGAPSFSNLFLFDDRLWGISSEDPNLLWYSKQVIEATPVEMSDLFTMYVAPSLGAQGPSGNLTCGFPMDDKAILFKKASISYFNGTGPDNTGANSQYSQPILVTSTLGCSNAKSIVFMPNGLMFEFASEAGNQIWLLGRDLSTSYIGAPVESLTQNATIQSAVNIPGTNQVRFTLSSGITLMYDYYYQQWGTFTGVPAISGTLYQGLHTYLNSNGLIYQENPGVYLDGTEPVLMRFTTSWLNLAGIQGYQRAYFFYLLGKYISPHKLYCTVAFDFNPSATQASLITPTNFAPTYGGTAANGQQTVYGQDSPYGGPGNVENWRVFLSQQRCSAFQVSVSEIYDPSFGIPAGAGLTLSGINLVLAAKKNFRTIAAANSIGG